MTLSVIGGSPFHDYKDKKSQKKRRGNPTILFTISENLRVSSPFQTAAYKINVSASYICVLSVSVPLHALLRNLGKTVCFEDLLWHTTRSLIHSCSYHFRGQNSPESSFPLKSLDLSLKKLFSFITKHWYWFKGQLRYQKSAQLSISLFVKLLCFTMKNEEQRKNTYSAYRKDC